MRFWECMCHALCMSSGAICLKKKGHSSPLWDSETSRRLNLGNQPTHTYQIWIMYRKFEQTNHERRD